jgi:hypothetical protein
MWQQLVSAFTGDVFALAAEKDGKASPLMLRLKGYGDCVALFSTIEKADSYRRSKPVSSTELVIGWFKAEHVLPMLRRLLADGTEWLILDYGDPSGSALVNLNKFIDALEARKN